MTGRTADENAIRALLSLETEARVMNTTFAGRMSRGQAAVQASYTEIFRSARLIRQFETAYVPGPLQIPGYARRVLTEMIALHDLAINDVDAAIAERVKRGQMLYDPAKQWEILLAEPVLRWLLPEPSVMREQLDRLQTVIGLERVKFGIVPMGVRLVTTPQNTVEIFDTPEGLVAVAETFIGETWHRGDEAAAYSRALDRQWKDAAEGDAARKLIVRARDALREEGS